MSGPLLSLLTSSQLSEAGQSPAKTLPPPPPEAGPAVEAPSHLSWRPPTTVDATLLNPPARAPRPRHPTRTARPLPTHKIPPPGDRPSDSGNFGTARFDPPPPLRCLSRVCGSKSILDAPGPAWPWLPSGTAQGSAPKEPATTPESGGIFGPPPDPLLSWHSSLSLAFLGPSWLWDRTSQRPSSSPGSPSAHRPTPLSPRRRWPLLVALSPSCTSMFCALDRSTRSRTPRTPLAVAQHRALQPPTARARVSLMRHAPNDRLACSTPAECPCTSKRSFSMAEPLDTGSLALSHTALCSSSSSATSMRGATASRCCRRPPRCVGGR